MKQIKKFFDKVDRKLNGYFYTGLSALLLLPVFWFFAVVFLSLQ